MFTVATIAVVAAMAVVLARAFAGPTLYDRVLAGNSFGTKTVLLIGLMGYLTGRPDFLDIALLYALINFAALIAILKFFRYRTFTVGLLGASTDKPIFSEEETKPAERGAIMSLALFLDICSWILFLVGGAAVFTGAVGLVRFPDFYARLHAAGVTDTAGGELILLGMLLQAPSWIVAVKLAFIGFFLFFTSPVATHAIAHAAWIGGLKPLLGADLKREDEE